MPVLPRTAFALVAALALPPSATPAEKEVGSVQGKVRFEGTPVAKGKLTFHPAKGKPVVAPIKDGSYSAKAVPVGEVGVTVEGKGIPRQYASKNTTPLKVTVKEGKNRLDIELTK